MSTSSASYTRKCRADLIADGFQMFPVTPTAPAKERARRTDVIGAEDPIRDPDKPGVYVYFTGERCLYVGKAAHYHLVGRALDYLRRAGNGNRTHVHRVILEHANSLLIRKADDIDDARRMELFYIVALHPVLNEGFIYASHQERMAYGLPKFD